MNNIFESLKNLLSKKDKKTNYFNIPEKTMPSVRVLIYSDRVNLEIESLKKPNFKLPVSREIKYYSKNTRHKQLDNELKNKSAFPSKGILNEKPKTHLSSAQRHPLYLIDENETSYHFDSQNGKLLSTNDQSLHSENDKTPISQHKRISLYNRS